MQGALTHPETGTVRHASSPNCTSLGCVRKRAPRGNAGRHEENAPTPRRQQSWPGIFFFLINSVMKWRYKSIKKFFCLCFQSVLRLLLIAISAAVSLVQAIYPLLGWISAIAIGSLFCPCPPSATAHIQIMSCLFKTYNGCPWHLIKKSKALLWFLSLYLIWPRIASLTSLFIISSDFFIHVSWGQKVIKLVSIIQGPGTTFVVKDSNISAGNCFIVILSKSRDQIATGSSD